MAEGCMEALGSLLLWGETTEAVTKGSTCEVQMKGNTWTLVCERIPIVEGTKFSTKKQYCWNGTLIEALGRLGDHIGFAVYGVIVEAEEKEATIRFDIKCSQVGLDEMSWKSNKPIARVFEVLEPWDSAIEHMTRVPWGPEIFTSSPSIGELFKETPTVESALRDIQNSTKQSSWLEKLPDEVLVEIFQKLDSLSFRSLKCCSRSLMLAATDAIPCLVTNLCKHQRDGLIWMTMRERPTTEFPHPCMKSITSSAGKEYSLNVVSGNIQLGAPPILPDCRGGVLADEPGLGKTVTILSLVMRTKGLLPEVLSSTVQTYKDGHGNLVGYYTIPKSELMSIPGNQEIMPDTPEKSAPKRKVRSSSRLPNKGCNLYTPISTRKRLRSSSSSTARSTSSYWNEARRDSLSSNRTSDMGIEDSEQGEDQGLCLVKKWVQCDGCSKWREVPEDYQVDEAGTWYCALNPDPAMSSCEFEQQPLDGAPVSHESGFVAIGTPGNDEANCQLFRQVLQRFETMVKWDKAKYNPIKWLVTQDPKDISKGVTVPSGFREPKEYGVIFEALGLEKVCYSDSVFIHKRSSRGPKQHTWTTPETHSSLHFDIAALQSALQELRIREKEIQIHLSRATLVVLPSTLIEQWKGEISEHFPGDMLKVKVVTRQAHHPAQVHQLAWDYDVVITTFTHCSSEHKRQESPFLLVHWLRVILDEGHIIGSNPQADTCRNRLLRTLRAERRWVMTGTPTPNTPSSNAGHLYPLLSFLHQEPYGMSKRIWEDSIQRPFEAGKPQGVKRLRDVLNHLFIRASKEDLNTLPNMKKTIKLLDFEPTHAESFNQLVEVIQRNILLADWGEASHNESLLNPKNAKWGRQMAENLRLSCCIAGNSNLQVNEEDMMESILLLSDRMGISHYVNPLPPYIPGSHPFVKVAMSMRNGGPCQKCNAEVRMPILTPCGHLLCTGCLGAVRFECPLPSCRKPFKIQSPDDPLRLVHNPAPERPVPIEVIEWQSSYTQSGAVGISGGEWNPNWEATQSSKCAYLVQRLRQISAVGDPTTGKPPESKAIVFSLFWRHHKLIERTLQEAGIKFCFHWKSMDAKMREANLSAFRHCPESGVLLMDDSGAVGLDLSMANWVFLMEPLADKSLEEQIISRAHRMGALNLINVEVLVMRGSAEEQLLQLSSDKAAGVDVNPGYRGNRRDSITGQNFRHVLLSNLKRAKLASSYVHGGTLE